MPSGPACHPTVLVKSSAGWPAIRSFALVSVMACNLPSLSNPIADLGLQGVGCRRIQQRADVVPQGKCGRIVCLPRVRPHEEQRRAWEELPPEHRVDMQLAIRKVGG